MSGPGGTIFLPKKEAVTKKKKIPSLSKTCIFSHHVVSVEPTQGKSSGHHLPSLSKPELAMMGRPQLCSHQKRTCSWSTVTLVSAKHLRSRTPSARTQPNLPCPGLLSHARWALPLALHRFELKLNASVEKSLQRNDEILWFPGTTETDF